MPRGRNTLAVNTFRLRAAARERKSAMKQKNGRIGGLPANINIMNPVPNKDAKSITGLVRKTARCPDTSSPTAGCSPSGRAWPWPNRGASGAWPSPAATAASTCAPSQTGRPRTTWGTCPPPARNKRKNPLASFPARGFFSYLESTSQRGTITRPSSSGARTFPQRTSRHWRTASRRAPGRNGSSCCSALRP